MGVSGRCCRADSRVVRSSALVTTLAFALSAATAQAWTQSTGTPHVPGASVGKIQQQARTHGFRCLHPRRTNPRDRRQLTWTCTRPVPTAGLVPLKLQIEAFGHAPDRLQLYGIDAPLAGIEFNTALVRRSFLLVASLPYAGARPRAARSWVGKQLRAEHPLGRRSIAVIGSAQLEIFAGYDELRLAVTPLCTKRMRTGVPVC
jgi:hypothetical protein